MLNPFPIQFLALFAYFILRLFLGATLVYLGLSHYRHRHELSQAFTLPWWPYGRLSTVILIVSEFLLAGFIVAGAYTQYAMIVVALMAVKFMIIRPIIAHPAIPSRLFYFLLLGISLTLFITGAGLPAFDLPI